MKLLYCIKAIVLNYQNNIKIVIYFEVFLKLATDMVLYHRSDLG
jgi:hypothetical protein